MSSFLAPTYETRCSVQKLEKLSKTQIGLINTTMQACSKTKHQAEEEEEESNSSCHVVEDYLTNPYMLDHHIRVRSVSGSGAMSSQRSAEESGSFIRTPVIDRLSSFRSRASSLSSYLTSSSSSSSSTLSSLTLQSTPSSSISPSSISQSSPSSPIPCENTHQFWSKYKRTQSKSSLTDLVKKVTALQKLKT